MARIVIASASENGRAQLSRLLSSSGFQVFRCCASGGELRRSLNECDDGIVIMLGAVPDCKPDELQWDYRGRVQILLIGKPALLDSCESAEVFRLPLPVSGQAIAGAVEMLSQLHQMRLPKRTAAENETVDAAKRILMARRGMTEPEAHRALQQHAMRSGMRLADYAAKVIQEEE